MIGGERRTAPATEFVAARPHYMRITTRRGASVHLVRASRNGAPLRPTIAPAISGPWGHSPAPPGGLTYDLRRNATIGATPGASVTDQDFGLRFT
jgi:hypothetical protein